MNNSDMEVGVPVEVWGAWVKVSGGAELGGYYFEYADAALAHPSADTALVEVVKLSDGRVVEVGKPVHVVWDAEGEEAKREAALSKLTPEERIMLGLGGQNG